MATSALILNPKTILSELEKLKPQMEAALPKHLNAGRMARIALTALRINPKLFACTPESFFGSLIAASQLGLEPGVNGQCYLIPYKNICTLVPGWKGYMDLLSRTGRASAWTNAVYDGDSFDYEYGDKPFVHHKPGKWAGEKAALEYVYAVGRQNGMEWPTIDVWDTDKIWKHRNQQNKVGDRHYSYAYPEMYARKIPLLQVIKYLPSSVELRDASALDYSAAEGKQKLTIDMALTGLDTGGLSLEEDVEAESLMEQLHWSDDKRQIARDSYGDRREELLAYLRKQLREGGGHHAEKVTSIKTEQKQEPQQQGESREEFERDRMGQTGEDNARQTQQAQQTQQQTKPKSKGTAPLF